MRMHPETAPKGWRAVPVYVACYALWVGFCGLGVWVAWLLWEAVPDIITQFSLDAWVLGFWEKVGVILIGLFWLGYVLFLESYLRDGVPTSRLLVRTAKALVATLVILGLAYGLQAIVSQ